MKTIITLAFLVVFPGIYIIPVKPPTPNPASLYARFMGYKSEIRTNASGEYGVCTFPDGSECEEWAFFRGLCGKKFSYCALKGCETGNVQTKGLSYCVCICSDSLGKKDSVRLDIFMEKHGDTLIPNRNKHITGLN